LEPLFDFTHYPTQSSFALLLEMLLSCTENGGLGPPFLFVMYDTYKEILPTAISSHRLGCLDSSRRIVSHDQAVPRNAQELQQS
jgi:hypothetical protein